MAIRIDWLAIRTFFLASDTITLKSCAEKFSVDYGTLRQKSSDEKWSEQKDRIRRNALNLLDQRTSKEIARRNQEQVQFARMLLLKATEALKAGVVPKNAKEIRQWIDTGIRIERLALGLENQTNSKSVFPASAIIT